MDNLESQLAGHPFLSGLEPRFLPQLAGCATPIEFRAGQEILREGQEAKEFYLLRQGQVAVDLQAYRRKTIVVHTLGEGEVLGWAWLVEPYRWQFSARAVQLTRAIALSVPCVLSQCDAQPELGYFIMRRMASVLAKQVRSLKLRLVDFYGV